MIEAHHHANAARTRDMPGYFQDRPFQASNTGAIGVRPTVPTAQARPAVGAATPVKVTDPCAGGTVY